MTIRHAAAMGLALGLGLMLGSCGSFSDVVSDHWPHFAGGEPNGVPPRPGTPGYAQFIAHGQPSEAAASGTGNGQPLAGGATSPVVEQRPLGDVQQTASGPSAPPSAGVAPRALPPIAAPVGAANAVQGGLY